MKKMTKYALSILGLTSVFLFCISATAGMVPEQNIAGRLFSEPMTMIFQGIVLIGLGQFIKSKSS
ncbi:MAG: hypothetical protein PVJ84_17065 [Desulfobacteraceae bacterium]|jgi:hypothetical protein